MSALKIEVADDAGVVTLNGVRFTISCLSDFLEKPPSDAVFSFRRNGDQMAITSYRDVEAVRKFFEK